MDALIPRQETRIRPIRPEDVLEIADLARIIWQKAYFGIISQGQIDYMLKQRYEKEVLCRDLENAQKWLDQVFLGENRAGFICCEVYKGEFKLDKLYIHPDFQRQGIGGKLIDHATKRAKENGYPAIILAVNKKNQQAIQAYRKYGFKERESVCVDIGQNYVMCDYIMAKPL